MKNKWLIDCCLITQSSNAISFSSKDAKLSREALLVIYLLHFVNTWMSSIMLRAKSWMISSLRALHYSLWPLFTVVASALDKSQSIEKERTSYYDSKRFYSTYLGEILNDRYQIATKLGYDINFTVWLARDLHQFVFLRLILLIACH